MSYLLKGSKTYVNGAFVEGDVLVNGGAVDVSPCPSPVADSNIIDVNNCFIFPGLVDVHVHLREPGFSYKETILSGTQAAASMGYTDICTMPNLNPVPDCAESLEKQLEIICRDAAVNVYPYGAITVGQMGEALSKMDEMSENVIAFSDDGRGVQSEEMMLAAMQKAKQLNRIIAAHCEDDSLLNGGYIHAGPYAEVHGHRGISSESEFRQIERDLRLAAKVGCKYHVCHISTKESVAAIRKAKAAGVDVTCETAPHYLLLTQDDLKEDAAYKMNPPLRCEADRQALIEGILDGTVDMIATDHAPHSAEEKNKGLEKSAMGIVGLETAFPMLYTKLVKTNIITLEKLIWLMSVSPSERFGIDMSGSLAVYDLNSVSVIDPQKFKSMGKSTPFAGEKVFGKCKLTFVRGKLVSSNT